MPPIHKVKSLLCICFNFVAKNIDKFSSESLEKDPDSEEDDVNVPFSLKDLPSAVLGDLSIALRRNGKQVYREFVHLLIVPNLRTADLSVFSPEDLDNILPLVARECPDLTSLFISGHDHLDYRYNPTFDFYFSLIQTFEKLEVLYVSYTSIPDSCLDLLGSNCKELRKLNVDGCPVTDAGIERLCVIGECKLIEHLDIQSTKVTSEGVIMALQNLSSLTVLLHHFTNKALHEIHKLGASENKLSDLTKFSLSKISISYFEIHWRNWEKFLKSTVFLCPSITQVDLRGDSKLSNDSILIQLLPLEKLERLDVDGCGNAGGLLSFLKERGSSIKHLSTSVVHEDCIPSISQYCPNLRSLSLKSLIEVVGTVVRHIKPQVRRQWDKLIEQPILKYLEKLELFNLDAILTESISLLLSSPSLKYVDIFNCPAFTDNVLKRATNAHSFPNLVSYEMLHCELATHKILDILLQDNVSDHLSSIKLQWWEQKEPSNFDQIVNNWRKMKEKKRWDLKIWLCYEFQHVDKRMGGPFEYSNDEETDEDEDEDEDEIIKNNIIII